MADEFKNQVGILDIDDFDYLKIAIIGVGSIGSFLAVALNKLGFKNIMIIDNDTLKAHNFATQFYLKPLSRAGNSKVGLLERYLSGNIQSYKTKVIPNHKIRADVVFLCVDSLKQRKIIMKALLDSYDKYKEPKLIIDGRMFRLLFRVFTIDLGNQKVLNYYVKGLLGQEFKGNCTEKGIIQNVYGVVGVMVEQLKKILKNEAYHAVINCDFEKYNFVKQMQIGQKTKPKGRGVNRLKK